MDPRWTTGRLLISSPSMTDLNFDRTVVFVLEHSEEGAIGVVLNRPTPVDLVHAVPQWAPFAAEPPVVFIGGPVSQGAVIALARAQGPETSDFTPIVGDVGVLDISKEPADMEASVAAIRLFTGYSGWAPGQLDGELEAGAWFVIDAQPEDPLSPEPDDLWTVALKRSDGVEAMRSQDPRRHWLN